MTFPNFSPEAMQAAVQLNNQRTGRTTPYGKQGPAPAQAAPPPPAQLPNGASAVPPWMANAPVATPEQMAASVPATPTAVPAHVQAALAAQPPAQAPQGAPAAPMAAPGAIPMTRGDDGQMGYDASAGTLTFGPGGSVSFQPGMNGGGGTSPLQQQALMQTFMAKAGLNPSLPDDRNLGMMQFAAAQQFANDQQKQQLAMGQLGLEGNKLALAGQQFAYQKSPQGLMAAAIAANPGLASDSVALANLNDALNKAGFGASSPPGPMSPGSPVAGAAPGQPATGNMTPQESAMLRLRGLPGGKDLTNNLDQLAKSGNMHSWEQAFDVIRGALGDQGVLQNRDLVLDVLKKYGLNQRQAQIDYAGAGMPDAGIVRNAGMGMANLVGKVPFLQQVSPEQQQYLNGLNISDRFGVGGKAARERSALLRGLVGAQGYQLAVPGQR